MAELLKHVGKYGEKPCVVVFREVPNEPDNCLIVESSTLEETKHDALMNVVQSTEAQESNNLSEVLARRQFSDGTNMLNDLHFSRKLQKVTTDLVFLTPAPNQKVALTDVNVEIRKIETGSNPASITEVDPAGLDTQPATTDVVNESNTQNAESLIVQAELLEEDAKRLLADAEAKRSEAYTINQSLNKEKSKGSKKSAE